MLLGQRILILIEQVDRVLGVALLKITPGFKQFWTKVTRSVIRDQ